MRTHRGLCFTFLLLLWGATACSNDEDAGSNDSGVVEDTGTGGGDGSTGADAAFGCTPSGGACTAALAGDCCSGTCGSNELCVQTDFCGNAGTPCDTANDCCTLRCVNQSCDGNFCDPIGAGCTSNDDCCSGVCGSGGACEALPPGPGGETCGTIGETCTSTAGCCSTNCRSGLCAPAFSCQADGDICRGNSDCCGNVCSATSPSTPGRCERVTGGGAGGCTQGGNPCESGTGCCSRICIDLGSGAKVCQIAGGCRLTGTSCTDDQSCCGGGSNPNGSVVCEGAPNGRCDNGQSCNPVGNICGAPVLPSGGSINASQNCCDGRKEVCKLDTSGIPRCFGGCPDNNCDQDCPTGLNPDDPNCCLGAGEACQFRDQCCGRSPCLPDTQGVLRCTAATVCKPLGTACSPTSTDPLEACCAGTSCLATADVDVFACQNATPPPPPPDADAGVSDDAGTVPQCLANGAACSAGVNCCTGICENQACGIPQSCNPLGGACTASADCCSLLFCDVPPGQTSGACRQGNACASPGQACSPNQACCSGLVCFRTGSVSPCDGTTRCSCSLSL
jgi:hypothetical protein